MLPLPRERVGVRGVAVIMCIKAALIPPFLVFGRLVPWERESTQYRYEQKISDLMNLTLSTESKKLETQL